MYARVITTATLHGVTGQSDVKLLKCGLSHPRLPCPVDLIGGGSWLVAGSDVGTPPLLWGAS